jgi:Transcriptional regulator
MEGNQEKKLDRRVKYTRMVITKSFVKLLGEKPLSKISVKEICELADVNRATFYKHYADPHNLLSQIEHELIADVNTYLYGMQYGNLDTVAVNTLENIFKYIRENAELCRVMLSDSSDLRFRNKIVEVVQHECIRTWKETNLILPENAEYAFIFAAFGSVGIIQKWMNDGMEKSNREMAELISNMTTRGILA